MLQSVINKINAIQPSKAKLLSEGASPLTDKEPNPIDYLKYRKFDQPTAARNILAIEDLYQRHTDLFDNEFLEQQRFSKSVIGKSRKTSWGRTGKAWSAFKTAIDQHLDLPNMSEDTWEIWCYFKYGKARKNRVSRSGTEKPPTPTKSQVDIHVASSSPQIASSNADFMNLPISKTDLLKTYAKKWHIPFDTVVQMVDAGHLDINQALSVKIVAEALQCSCHDHH
jgi:hypothetical protein